MQQVRNRFAAALAVLNPPGPFALAVSGGPDSTALMHLAAALKPVVFTVDHGLRSGSDAEAAGVAAAAAELGLSHETLRWAGAKPEAGLQEAARAARYDLLADACARVGAATLMTGHTLDDQIETVAMRKAKGSGPYGLAGMPAQTQLPGGGVRLARPLLWARKGELIAWLERMRAAYVTDPSNADPRFDRGRLRALGVEADLGAMAGAARARVEIERAALAFLDGVAKAGRALVVGRADLAGLAPDLADVVLSAILRRAGSGPYPGTRAERERLRRAVAAPGEFAGRTLAGCLIRRATRAEAGGAEAVAFLPEQSGRVPAEDWWLPFGQFPQIGPDGGALT